MSKLVPLLVVAATAVASPAWASSSARLLPAQACCGAAWRAASCDILRRLALLAVQTLELGAIQSMAEGDGLEFGPARAATLATALVCPMQASLGCVLTRRRGEQMKKTAQTHPRCELQE